MNNNKQKKNIPFTHRRVRTDNVPQSQTRYNSTQRPSLHSNSYKRTKTELYDSSYLPIVLKTDHSRQSLSPNSPHLLDYNKWYIKPNVRMKRSLKKQQRQQEKDVQFAYNKLYEERKVREDCPFMTTANAKLEVLNRIPAQNLKLLEVFKKNREGQKKRVPKIIELFLSKKHTLRNIP